MQVLAIREVTIGAVVVRMLLACMIGGILGSDRARKNRPAGFRTYMLVCLGSTIVMLTNQYVVQCMGTGDPVRLGAQVISGIGFLGAGSIIVTGRNQIRGLTTAAGLWAAACLGLAIGIGFYEVALVGGVLILIVLTAMQSMDAFLQNRNSMMDAYIELESKEDMPEFIDYMRQHQLTMTNLQLEPDYPGAGSGFAFVITIRSIGKQNREGILTLLHAIPHLKYIEEL